MISNASWVCFGHPLIADEPVSSVDEHQSARLLDALDGSFETMVLALHDNGRLFAFGGNLYRDVDVPRVPSIDVAVARANLLFQLRDDGFSPDAVENAEAALAEDGLDHVPVQRVALGQGLMRHGQLA